MENEQILIGCKDPSLSAEKWGEVFADLAEHLEAAAGTSLYGEDWRPADEGCVGVFSPDRARAIRAKIAAFDGPVKLY